MNVVSLHSRCTKCGWACVWKLCTKRAFNCHSTTMITTFKMSLQISSLCKTKSCREKLLKIIWKQQRRSRILIFTHHNQCKAKYTSRIVYDRPLPMLWSCCTRPFTTYLVIVLRSSDSDITHMCVPILMWPSQNWLMLPKTNNFTQLI